MDARTFFDRVTLMRYYQKSYFKARKERQAKSVCDQWLRLSCSLEEEIDAEIKRVQEIKNIPSPEAQQPQQMLFNFNQ